jgi:hypothetical protein
MPSALAFRPARREGAGQGVFFPVKHYPVVSGESFLRGAPLTQNSQEVDEIDTNDVTLILGVAGAASESGFGYGNADTVSHVTGRENTVPVYLADRNQIFFGQLSNGTTSLVVPDNDNVGEDYGVIRQSDGTWTVDEADTSNVVVVIIDFVTQGPECADPFGGVFFRFLDSTLAP